MPIKRLVILAIMLVCLGWAWAAPAGATAHFSAQTSLSCAQCHENPDGGGTLTAIGHRFRSNGFSLSDDSRPSAWRDGLALAAGFVHIVAAVIWFGAIFYIHMFIGPRSLTSGIPRNERILGLSGLSLVALSGVVLTWLRIPDLEHLWTTTFGLVWLVKVFFFLVMLTVAVLTNTYIDRRLRREAAQRRESAPAVSDGQEGRPAHLIHQGRLYDVSASKLWKNGTHMGRHRAGGDLTEALASAPHGPEVLQRVENLGPAPPAMDQEAMLPASRLLVVLAYLVLGCMLVILFCLAWWRWGPPLVSAAPAWNPIAAASCLHCHGKSTPAVLADWQHSAHARAKVSCLHCHLTTGRDPARTRAHQALPSALQASAIPPVRALVSPRNCAACHPRPVREFAASKHAATLSIIEKVDPMLIAGQVRPIERATGCRPCHGGVIRTGAQGLDPATWPDTGVGRLNPDGSRGSCAVCHGRHKFNLADARHPQTCGQCHQGPDQPQYEIWRESKHGAIYLSQGRTWNFSVPPETWTAGLDYRAPTCAACHMSGSGNSPGSHDVTRRLAWEIQSPLSVRPQDFKPFPAPGDWRQARANMKKVCLRCHAAPWVDGHFTRYDQAVQHYNTNYYLPAAAKMKRLSADPAKAGGKVTNSPLWTAFHETWRRPGRQARMGAAMMAPDYTWWHGFYELKKSWLKIMEE